MGIEELLKRIGKVLIEQTEVLKEIRDLLAETEPAEDQGEADEKKAAGG
jgi:hypothetical protein